MRAEDQFHAGIVVDDVAATTSELSALFGYEWTDVIEATVTVALPSGDRSIDQQLVYSRTVPRLEIIRTVPDTLWVPAAGSGVHHLGYWSDDVAADAAALEARGFAREAAGLDADGNAYWTYHRAASGPRIELMTRALEAALGPLWS